MPHIIAMAWVCTQMVDLAQVAYISMTFTETRAISKGRYREGGY